MDNQDWLASMVGVFSKLAMDVDSGAERVRSAYLHGAGAVQERFVEALLAHGALPGRLRTWTNVLVPKDGAMVGEAELDVLMLHERGVFVFESKNYSGWIFGSEGQRQWTQVLNRATKTRFYNPLMQNAAHVRALSRRLVVPEESFVSYVVFSERCELKEVPMRGEGWRVCRDDDLLRLVRADLAEREVAFNGLQFSTIEQRIDSLAAASTSGARERLYETANDGDIESLVVAAPQVGLHLPAYYRWRRGERRCQSLLARVSSSSSDTACRVSDSCPMCMLSSRHAFARRLKVTSMMGCNFGGRDGKRYL